MPVPNTSVTKSSVGGSPAVQTNLGVLAILASAPAGGTAAQPGIYSNQAAIAAAFGGGYGPLPEYGAYVSSVSGRPVLLQKVVGSVAASYGSVTKTGTGTFTVTATAATFPYEHYNVGVTFVTGGTLGTAGITYTYYVDGVAGLPGSVSGVQALGTGVVIAIPNTGLSFTLATTGTSTVVAGDAFTCNTERQLLNNTDTTTALAVLNTTRLPWEGVLIDAEYITGNDPTGTLDTWLGAREKVGQFNFGLLNTRYLLEPTPTAESSATYSAAMLLLVASDASNRVCVGADGGRVVSLVTGFNLKRPTSLALGAMAMSLTPDIGTDPAYVGNGPVPGFSINVGGNPSDWDEANYGGVTGILDPGRFVTLRTFASGGPQGVYITNANVLAPTGSSIVYLQLLRILNSACSVAWSTLNTQLSKGVNTVFNSVTGNTNIDPAEAQIIEGVVNGPLAQALSGQVTNQNFALNRDDPLNTPGAPVTGNVGVVAKFYIKQFNVIVSLVKTISVPLGGA